MRKSEIVRAAAKGSRLSQPTITESVNRFLTELMTALAAGETVELRGFCVLEPYVRAARSYKMPGGSIVSVPRRWALRVKPSAKWTEAGNRRVQSP